MVPLDYVLAVAVLATPPCTSDTPQPAGPLVGLRPTLRSLALSWELLDPREEAYVFAEGGDFDADLDFLRRRCCNLADAPPLADCQRFPPREVAADLLTFNRAYRRALQLRLVVGTPWPEQAQAALVETDRLYHVWDALRDAASDGYYVSVRRQALRALREALGPECYAYGALPPHVPVGGP
jgi:hypothetical protein